MSKDELVGRYLEGQMSRRAFLRRLVASGVSIGAAVAYADVLRAVPAAAAGGDFYILVADYSFTPALAKLAAPGRQVQWHNSSLATHNHTATDTTGMKYFDSGPMTQGSDFFKRFIAAGTYTYICSELSHPTFPMTGTIKVPMKVDPASGPVGTVFTIRWASRDAPSNYVYDVQRKRPSDASFSDWKIGATAKEATFSPNRAGRFAFRARLRKTSNGETSGYSKPKTIDVT